METSFGLKSQAPKIIGAFTALLLLTTSACATRPRGAAASRADSGEPGAPRASGVVDSPRPSEDYGPQPVPGPRPLVVVLGPGMARGLAHFGFLRALKEEGIPVAAVVGTEMGALAATLYALTPSVNQMEWALLQFKPESFYEPKGMFSALTGRVSRGASLQQALTKTLGEKTLETARPRLGVMTSYDGSSASSLQDRGNASQHLRGALANPGIMEPAQQGKDRWVASSALRPYPVSEARLLGDGPVVVVDVLGASVEAATPTGGEGPGSRLLTLYQEARAVGAKDLGLADLVIRIPLSDIAPLAFEKKTEIIYRGKRAALKELGQLRALAGLTSQEKPRHE